MGTVGRLLPATLFSCINMLLVLHFYCSLYVLLLWVLLVQWYQPLYVSDQYVAGTAIYIYWYCGYFWYIGTSHAISLCLYVTGTKLVLLFVCTGTVGTFGNWYQPIYVNVSISYWYHTGTALYMCWYSVYCWYTATSHSIFLYQYVTDTALILLFICTATVGTVGTLVPATR